MPRSERIVLIVYGLLFACLCVWLPFSVYPRAGT